MITTNHGDIVVEDLRQGDMVLTRDNGFKPIRWIGGRYLSREVLAEHTNLRPVRIRAGALGEGLPTRDLMISPQHRVLVKSTIAERMFNEAEVLVSAKSLVFIDGIDYVESGKDVTYYYILFDQHEVIWSNDAPTESLYTGPEAIKSLPETSRKEIFEIFPELAEMDCQPTSCRSLIPNRMGRKLAMRHWKNRRPLQMDPS